MKQIFQKIAAELTINVDQVAKTVQLIDAGNTIPFIARYRKEVTGSLSDEQLRNLNDRLVYLRHLVARRGEVERLIDEQGGLTPAIVSALQKADKLSIIEDIYRPFKPKRRSRASIAKERGLLPLANLMLNSTDEALISARAADFVSADKAVETVEAALAGAADIVAERFSDSAALRAVLRQFYQKSAVIKTAPGKQVDAKGTYDMYLEFSENAFKMPAHRVLAINRAEREGCLKVALALDDDSALQLAASAAPVQPTKNAFVDGAYRDAYKRLIAPALQRELRSALTERAEEQAIAVFGINLKQLLLQPPFKGKVVLGYDPAYRTGCKLAVIDATGKLCDYQTIYPTKPQQAVAQSEKIMLDLIAKYQVELIAIGNGTASRESEQFVAQTLKKQKRKIHYIIVNEAGASVYSASPLGTAEYPTVDVSIRGAISIAARVQDPLSELVKIEPQSIGVGQYQHDVNQKRLRQVLDGVVEAAVNSVGVDLNVASAALLGHIAGISAKTAAAIVDYRHAQGGFKSRAELLKVKGVGAAAFQQAAGFLRVAGSAEPLDNSAVHPESYAVCHQLMNELAIAPNEIGRPALAARAKGEAIGLSKLAKKFDIHPVLLRDLLTELDKPARDPRADLAPPLLRSDVMTIEDLTVGMVLKGTVRNVVDFGAFVDIGVKQDGLVHISELANRFVKRAMDVVAVGDVVNVKVIGIDLKRQKVSLSIKQAAH